MFTAWVQSTSSPCATGSFVLVPIATDCECHCPDGTECGPQAILSEFSFPTPTVGSNGGCKDALSQGGFGSMVMSEIAESRPKDSKAARGSMKAPAWWYDDTSGTGNGGGVSASDGSDTTQVQVHTFC